MAPSDHNRYDDAPRRHAPSGLTLSTGRLEGRPRAGSGTDSCSTRHNPLRDDERYGGGRRPERPSRNRPGNDPADRRHSGRGQATRASSRPAPSRAGQPRQHGPRVGNSLANSLISLLPTGRTSGHGGSFRRGIDLRTLGLGLIAFALAIVFVMAIAHVGPFAPPKIEDKSSHMGVITATAAGSNGGYIAQGIATQISLARPIEPDLANMPAHPVTREDIGGLAGQEAPYAFALNASEGEGGAGTPVLSDQSLVQLNNALAYYETNGYPVGYLLMDLGTGRGIAGNLDATVYGASSFKGPYCAYVAQKELPGNIDKVKSSRREQIENIILWSDNKSYSKLRRTFGTDGMEEWLAEAGVDTALVDDTSFPHYTARQSALMWLKIYEYLSTDSSTAQWLSDTFGNTEVSFLRNGALGTTSAGNTDYLPSEESGEAEAQEEAAMGSGDEPDGQDGAEGASGEGGSEVVVATDDGSSVAVSIAEDAAEGHDATVASIGTNIAVRNKAGWINGQEDDAICDSGIVTINGRDYLMTIMTGAPDTAAGEQAFAHLARTLLEIRSDLV